MAHTQDSRNAYAGRAVLNPKKDVTRFNYGDELSAAALSGTDFTGYTGQDFQNSYRSFGSVNSGLTLKELLDGIEDINPDANQDSGYVDTGDVSYPLKDIYSDLQNKIDYALNTNWKDALKDVLDTYSKSFEIGFGSQNNVLSRLAEQGKGLFNILAESNSASARGYGSIANAITSMSDASVQSNNDLMKLIQETTAANNEWSAAEAQKNRDWQERMSNTAHQREMADLQAAGLNPVLAAGGGSGASVGSGAVAQADTSNTRLLAEVAMQAIDAAQSSAAGLSKVASVNIADSVLGKIVNSDVGRNFLRSAGSTLGQIAIKAVANELGVPGIQPIRYYNTYNTVKNFTRR